MTALSWSRLLVVLAIATVVAWLGVPLALRAGATPVPLPISLAVVMAGLGVVALVSAWPVREYVGGRRPQVDALRAARVAVLAQATAFTAAVIAGLSAGYGLALAADWSHGPRREVIISAVIVLGVAVAAMVAAVVAERWCRIDESDDDAPGAQSPSGA